MARSQSATVIAIGLLFICAFSSAEDRSASSRQRYRIHVPEEVKFGLVDPAQVNQPVAQQTDEIAGSLSFMAETTSGLTIQFDSRSESPLPMKLTVGGGQLGEWWAKDAHDGSGTTHESTAEGTSVQASTLGAGWTKLALDVLETPAGPDETLPTIVVTIVAH